MTEADPDDNRINRLFLPRVLWHVFIAGVLAPIIILLWQHLRFNSGQIQLGSLGGYFWNVLRLVVAVAPVTLLFAAVTYVPIIGLVMMRRDRHRAIGFALVGALIGFLAAVGVYGSYVENLKDWIKMFDYAFLGMLFGYLDSLAWRDECHHENVTA